MNSNLLTITAFNRDYFEGYCVNGATNKVTCPHAKRCSVIDRSTLTDGPTLVTFFSARGNEKEEHPLNGLITQLLEIFHSRYVVAAWEKSPQAGPKTPDRQRLQLPSIPTKTGARKAQLQNKFAIEERNSFAVRATAAKRKPQKPSAKMYKDVKALADHAAVRDLLLDYLFSPELAWPPNDVIDDRSVKDMVDLPPQSDPPPEQPQTSEQAAVPQQALVPPLDQHPPAQDAPIAPKPAKRPRREPARTPVLPAGPSAQSGRVTRSRSAANATAAAAREDVQPDPSTALPVDIPRRMTRSQTRTSIKPAATPHTKATPADSGVASRARGNGRTTRENTRLNARTRQQGSGKDSAKNASSAAAGKRRTRRK
ncbi:hypothetical protein C8Q76DRAFT_193019 [Earliella scabrosa]|nr:hypothetical protein C8Q76DRAFT_193019 [Earliella scabrosa]